MDFTAKYCSTRRDLEERSWWLTTRLANLTGRLMQLVGHDHLAFVGVRQECQTAKAAITASRENLADHRRAHGC